jgi:WD40 repeat protein
LDGSNGYNYTDSAVTVGDSLTDFVIGSGYVIASQHLSPDIIVMSDIKDESYEGTYPIGSTLYSVLGSPSGENYAVLTSSDTYQYGISVDVHDTATGEQLAFFDIERAYSMDVKYVDDDTLVLPTYDKTICYLHIDSGELETIELEEDHFTDYLNSGDDTKRVAISNNEYKIFDIKEKKFVSSGKICEELYDCKFYRGIVDNSCKHLYYRSTEYVAYKFDFDTNEREIILDNFKVVGFAVSKDDSKLAVMCSDGFIRVVDAQTMEVCNVVENYGSENSFMQFSDDGTKLYYQGLDYYFKIYDLVNKKMIYISDGQWQSASYVKEYPAKNMLVFRNSNAIHILDTESYGVMLEAEKGDLYLENEDAILSGYSGELYKYKLKSLDELISEAKEKYGDKKLSVEKRLKYKLY